MAKTAMQQAIDKFQNEFHPDHPSYIVFKGIADELRKFLPTERQQIEAARNSGIEEGVRQERSCNPILYHDGRRYYSHTYTHKQ